MRIHQPGKGLTMRPSWKKVVTDLTGNKIRTVLVILSIAVGVFAVGFVATGFPIILSDMDADFQSVNPHAAIIYCDSFDDDLVNMVKRIEGVGEAEGRSGVTGRIIINPEKNVSVEINSIPKIEEMKIDRLQPENPDDQIPTLSNHHIFIERTGASVLGIEPGEKISVELADGKMRDLTLASYVHDVTAFPYVFTNSVTGYVTPETIEWLGGSQEYYKLFMTVSQNKTDEEHVKLIAKSVAEKIEKSGREVYYTSVYQPGRHFATDITQALGVMMAFLGALSVFLSAFLVINTITALLSQHIRQIGIMKSIGGKSYQLVLMYLGLTLSFGLLALMIAMPLSSFFAYQIAYGTAEYLNFNVRQFHIPIGSILLQVLIAIIIPVGAALYPVINGTRLTIREAISDYGLGKGRFGKNRIDRQLENIHQLPRPILLSLRNTFRRKGRLMLTLSTLTLAGAIFITVYNIKSAMYKAIEEAYGYFVSDVNVDFNIPYRIDRIKSIVMGVPGVIDMEGWGFSTGQILSDDKLTSTEVIFIAPPSGSTLIEPVLTGGRWLLPEDQNAVVIGNHLLKVRPELQIGDDIYIEIEKKETKWKIIGIFNMPGNTSSPIVYANYEYLAGLRNEADKISSIRLVTKTHDITLQEQVAMMLEKKFKQNGIKAGEIQTSAELKEMERSSMDVLIYFLLSMAILIAIVGGLGLTGTMSINVLERTREIGVMRAIGAKDMSIMMLVIVEGMLIGCISWILGTLLSFPISVVLSNFVGIAILSTPLNFVFSFEGFMIWLFGVLIISGLASVLPARNASRLTIREVLAYE